MHSIYRYETPQALLNGAVPAQVSPGYLNRKDAAAYLGLSVRTLERLYQDGGGPPVHIVGGRRCHSIAHLDAWIAERVVRIIPSNYPATPPR